MHDFSCISVFICKLPITDFYTGQWRKRENMILCVKLYIQGVLMRFRPISLIFGKKLLVAQKPLVAHIGRCTVIRFVAHIFADCCTVMCLPL